MKYPASPLTPFPPTFLGNQSASLPCHAPLEPICRSLCGQLYSLFVFHTIVDSFAFSKKPTPSQSSKSTLFFQNTRGEVFPIRLLDSRQESLSSCLGGKPFHLRALCASVAKESGTSAPGVAQF